METYTSYDAIPEPLPSEPDHETLKSGVVVLPGRGLTVLAGVVTSMVLTISGVAIGVPGEKQLKMGTPDELLDDPLGCLFVPFVTYNGIKWHRSCHTHGFLRLVGRR